MITRHLPFNYNHPFIRLLISITPRSIQSGSSLISHAEHIIQYFGSLQIPKWLQFISRVSYSHSSLCSILDHRLTLHQFPEPKPYPVLSQLLRTHRRSPRTDSTPKNFLGPRSRLHEQQTSSPGSTESFHPLHIAHSPPPHTASQEPCLIYASHHFARSRIN